MIETLFKTAKSDPVFATLLDEAREYAETYLLAKKTQRGCDGMGELTTMREEFRDVVDKMIQYSQERKYIPRDVSYDVDAIADEIVRR